MTLRRATSDILKLITRSDHPTQATGETQLYAQNVAGASQAFARASDGVIRQLSGLSSAADYIGVSRNGGVQSFGAATDIKLDTIESQASGSGLGLNGSGQVTNLLAFHTYRLYGALKVSGTVAGDYIEAQFWDITNNVVIGATQLKTYSFRPSGALVSTDSQVPSIETIFVPTVTTTIAWRMTGGVATASVQTGTHLVVLELL